ncbi:MAG: tRNA lysidine(34) synthetase TilS [Rhodospirillales bacterium]|nr:tRNA lysidine(34) synthetase TilS [Rhodospirillales bacterium]MCB9994972.1 tRNA lysidine(34) synthetase TilS [Rhodospirillales bacterium]
MMDSPFSLHDLVRDLLPADSAAVAVAVSGGPDSMALCHALSSCGANPVHALTVDHGLRPEADEEAVRVGRWLDGWPFVSHHILKRELDRKPDSKIQEEARFDRYTLLSSYCEEQGIGRLFTAHHQDDQAETFLFRLAKGSGLDGLGAMRRLHDYNECMAVCRPFLPVPKAALLSYCTAHNIPYVQDPSNENTDFARVRLRRSYEVLAEEGLSAKRLAVTAGRLARARDALEQMSDALWREALVSGEPGRIVLKYDLWRAAPEELRLRLVLKGLEALEPERYYGPRLEKVEALALRLYDDPDFKKASLAGCLIGRGHKDGTLILEKASP